MSTYTSQCTESLLTTRVRKVAENVAVVQARHRHLGNDHLQKRREGREDTELLRVESEASRSRKVAALHDAGGDEHLGVLLVDDLQPRRALQVAYALISIRYSENKG